MRYIVCILSILYILTATAQTKVYLFPGQGADKRLFDSLKLGDNYTSEVIEYGCPAKNETMQQFAAGLLSKIDTTQQFILIGTSLGGMICAELSERCHPQKTILISSAKNRTELPFRYRFQRQLPLYKLFPGFLIKAGALLLQPLVEPDRKKNASTFKAMLKSKSPLYMKRSIALIVNWQRTTNTTALLHIHGSKDHTLPIRRITNIDYEIKNGSHMMTLTRADELSKILQQVLNP